MLHRSALAALAELDADIYFLDPPYTQSGEYREALTLLGERTLRPGALVLTQHGKRLALTEDMERCVVVVCSCRAITLSASGALRARLMPLFEGEPRCDTNNHAPRQR